MKLSLVVMAAGMGSRYGGLKQLDPIGPNGETIMDYSIYDAIQAGFNQVVFVIRRDFEEAFRAQVLSKYEGRINTQVVFQESDKLPQGYQAPTTRVKPWGTNHALMMAADCIDHPFAVINADDFYGRDAFQTIANELRSTEPNKSGQYCMVGYSLVNTMSQNGSVSRGVCQVDAQQHLQTVVEHRQIIFGQDGTPVNIENNQEQPLSKNQPVSMNLWGFTPDYFEHSEQLFKEFLDQHINEAKSEFYIPAVVDHLIQTKQARVKVLRTDSSWFGVTYQEDRPIVEAELKNLATEGIYPTPLFGE